MSKFIITLFILGSFIQGQDDVGTPYVEVSEDTVLFGVDGMFRNCGALFWMDIRQQDNVFTIAAVDTGGQVYCNCNFDVWVESEGVAPGDYTALFYSYDLFNLTEHDTTFIGELSFTVEDNSGVAFLVLSEYQSPCYDTMSVNGNDLPKDFILFENYPNPFNPTTTIEYEVPNESHITLTIYDLMGRRVNELMSERVNPGRHSVIWNGTDEQNNPVSSGMYLYRLKAGDFVETKKLLLIK